MICWLFLLINCSTFPLICAQTNKAEEQEVFPLTDDYSTEQFFRFTTIHFYQLRSSRAFFRLGKLYRGGKEMKSLYFNIIDKWNHAIAKRHSFSAFSLHFTLVCVRTCLLCNWSLSSDATCLLHNINGYSISEICKHNHIGSLTVVLNVLLKQNCTFTYW